VGLLSHPTSSAHQFYIISTIFAELEKSAYFGNTKHLAYDKISKGKNHFSEISKGKKVIVLTKFQKVKNHFLLVQQKSFKGHLNSRRRKCDSLFLHATFLHSTNDWLGFVLSWCDLSLKCFRVDG
jgi:hypothetical protein